MVWVMAWVLMALICWFHAANVQLIIKREEKK